MKTARSTDHAVHRSASFSTLETNRPSTAARIAKPPTVPIPTASTTSETGTKIGAPARTAQVTRELRTRLREEAGARYLQARISEKLPPAPVEVVRDPWDVNYTPPADTENAKIVLGRSGQAERNYLAKLDDVSRKQYDAVARTIADDPVARLALQRMLFAGRLEGCEGRETLTELGRLSGQCLAAGIERGPLVADLVQELDDPTAISQEQYGTCAATVAIIYLARHDPSEYVRLVGGLASPTGQATLKNGAPLRREAETIDEAPSYHGSTRSQSERLLAAALMEYGLPDADYDPVRDVHDVGVGSFKVAQTSGMNDAGSDRILEAVTGRSFATHEVSDPVAELRAIAATTARGEDVPATLVWEDDLTHRVLITKVDEKSVYFINPWGIEEKLSLDEAKRRLVSSSSPG